MQLPDGFYDLVVKCKKFGISDPIDRKDMTDEDIWDSAVFSVVLNLSGMLDEAQSHYLKKVLEKDSILLDKKFILTNSFATWSTRLLKAIEEEKNGEYNNLKLSTLSIIRPSNNPESPIRRLHDDLLSFLEYIRNKPLNRKYISTLSPDKDKELVAKLKINIEGIGYTKATIFCYGLGIAQEFSAVSRHVKNFVSKHVRESIDDEDYYVINHNLKKFVLEKYQLKDSGINLRHIDLAIYTLYVGRNQLFIKQKKNKITPSIILDWLDYKRFDLEKFLGIIADIDEIDNYAEDFTDFACNRL